MGVGGSANAATRGMRPMTRSRTRPITLVAAAACVHPGVKGGGGGGGGSYARDNAKGIRRVWQSAASAWVTPRPQNHVVRFTATSAMVRSRNGATCREDLGAILPFLRLPSLDFRLL